MSSNGPLARVIGENEPSQEYSALGEIDKLPSK